MSRRKLVIGIIGAGRIGSLHAETLAFRTSDAAPLIIADVNRAAAEKVAARCGIPRVTDSAAEVIGDPKIEAVLICSSTDTHAELIVAAAAAGKHIFCEKPIERTLARIDYALAAVEKAGVQLQIGFNRRFDPTFARVRKAVETGEIGTPHLLHIISRDPEPPPIDYIKVSGGIFLDMTIHDFDMARFLLGSEVEEVFTAAGVRVDPRIGEAGDQDTAVVVLRFKNGAIGTIENCRKAVYGYDQRVEVFGSGGAISTGNCYPNQALVATAKAVSRDLPLHFFLERYAESFAREMQAFVNAVLEGNPTPVTGIDGRIPVAMALAARKSHDEHRPVRLDEIR